MEVMQTAEFESDAVLIGQVGKTTSYRVSDDPMLMSMLSTGFYQNPMKTMTQEILFNAWDAHHMGNCTDTPIEIHLNQTTGLVIRDFGPGIPEDMMDEIYCVYGASTKRKDSRQTGGFGLGSKSPYSYTDSFTVISMNQGKKSVYLMVRVSEKTGKPAMTKIMESPTDETGLMVTIPLKSPYDLAKIKHNIHIILAHSGIKAVMTQEGVEEVIEFQSDALEPGQIVFVPVNNGSTVNRIQGIYGGVKYNIEKFDEFAEDYDFLLQFTESHQILIGFPPNSLTPLPNREGLNMNAPTKEAIKIMLEKLTENTRSIMNPLMNLLAKSYMGTALASELQPIFALTGAFSVANYATMFDSTKAFQGIMTTLNLSESDKIFVSMIHDMMKKDSKSLSKFMNPDEWQQIVLDSFLQAYPDEKEMAEVYATGLKNRTSFNKSETFYYDEWNQRVMAKLFEFHEKMKLTFPDDSTLWPVFRLGTNTLMWDRIFLAKEADGSFEFYYTTDTKGNYGRRVDILGPLLDSTVFLGKNTFCLRDSTLGFSALFKGPFSEYGLCNRVNRLGEAACIGVVVYTRKGAHSKAMQFLDDLDFDTILADDVVRPVYKKPKEPGAVKPVDSYPALIPHTRHFNDGTLVEDPTHMLYITKGDVESDYQRDKPGPGLIRIITSRHKTAWINNITTANKLEKSGCIHFGAALETWFNSLTTKKYRFRNIVRAIKISNEIGSYSHIIREPILHEILGMTPIKQEDTESFWKEFEEYNALASTEYREVEALRKKANSQIHETWKNDLMKMTITHNLQTFSFFEPAMISNLISEYNPEKKLAGLKAIERFVKDLKP
jgi:hypothetical protein